MSIQFINENPAAARRRKEQQVQHSANQDRRAQASQDREITRLDRADELDKTMFDHYSQPMGIQTVPMAGKPPTAPAIPATRTPPMPTGPMGIQTVNMNGGGGTGPSVGPVPSSQIKPSAPASNSIAPTPAHMPAGIQGNQPRKYVPGAGGFMKHLRETEAVDNYNKRQREQAQKNKDRDFAQNQKNKDRAHAQGQRVYAQNQQDKALDALEQYGATGNPAYLKRYQILGKRSGMPMYGGLQDVKNAAAFAASGSMAVKFFPNAPEKMKAGIMKAGIDAHKAGGGQAEMMQAMREVAGDYAPTVKLDMRAKFLKIARDAFTGDHDFTNLPTEQKTKVLNDMTDVLMRERGNMQRNATPDAPMQIPKGATPDTLVAGKVYQTLKGPRQWNGSRFMPLPSGQSDEDVIDQGRLTGSR